jgi:glycosyltransferase involved in cell wall biosynthesis
VTCLTPADQTICAELAPRALVRLVPNPTPVDEDAAPADSTSEVVLFAGEIGRRKGADVLRSAWDQVAEQRPQAHCLMIGPYTELEVAPGERMEIRPSVSREDLKPLLRNARVVALPSRAEALPMILTEAMAAGRPFVGTPVGSVPSLESGGSLVPVEDPDALAGALISYLSDPGLARDVGERGRSYCRSTRGIDHVDSVLRELYREAHSNH